MRARVAVQPNSRRTCLSTDIGGGRGQWLRGGHHGECGARGYNMGLVAEPPAGSRGRAPGQGVRRAKPPEAESILAIECPTEPANLAPFRKMSFRTSLHATKSLSTGVIDAIQKVFMNGLWIYQQQRIYLTENSMFC